MKRKEKKYFSIFKIIVSQVYGLILLAIVNFSLNSCQKAKELDALSVNSQIITVPRMDITIMNYCLPKSNQKIDFYGFNKNIRMEVSGAVYDTDGDGLVDPLEFKIANLFNLNLKDKDSNKDFYSDLITYKSGLSQQELTSLPIGSNLDEDGDGLNNAEENFIGTEFRFTDTDQDSIADGVELFFGLNPLIADAETDIDTDGLTNLAEIKQGMPIYENQKLNQDLENFVIDISVESTSSDDPNQNCYKYTLKNMALNPQMDSNELEFIFVEKVNSKLSFVIKNYQASLSELALKNVKETRYVLTLDYKNGLVEVVP